MWIHLSDTSCVSRDRCLTDHGGHQDTLAHPALSPSWSFHTENFSSFKITVTKHFQRPGVPKQRSQRASQGCLHTLHNDTRLKEWDKLKKGLQQAKVKPKGPALSFRTGLPPKDSEHTELYLLFLLKSFMRDLSFVLMKTTIFKALNCDPGVEIPQKGGLAERWLPDWTCTPNFSPRFSPLPFFLFSEITLNMSRSFWQTK